MASANRILIVEDEDVLAENLKAFLGRHAPDVRIAADGEKAIEMIETFAPDVVVLDYRLPQINGIRAYGEMVRRRARQVGCVLITGYPLETVAAAAKERGIDHLLCKPFSFSELQQLVERSAEEKTGSE
ncbi:MAG: response regulator [Betaproteobacteria bacterium]|nr:response regulator [Betaproteobacteria bacterium]MBI2960449.1 response regulator [Betaproteobacteria bacterium]